MSSISPSLVATYAPCGALSQKDLIEIGKNLPTSFIRKCIKIIIETFSFIPFVNKAFNGYFANRAVEEIIKYNNQFIKDYFFPTEEMFASIKNYLETHSTSIIDVNTVLYKKVNEICRAHDLMIGIHEGGSFLIKAYDLSSKKEKNELINSRIKKLDLNKKVKVVNKKAVNQACQKKNSKIIEPSTLLQKGDKDPVNAENKLNMANVGSLEFIPDQKVTNSKEEQSQSKESGSVGYSSNFQAKGDISASNEKSSYDKLLAAFESNPSAIASSFLIELCRNFLKAEQISQLTVSMQALSPLINHLIKNLYLVEAQNEAVIKLNNEFLNLISKEDSILTRRQRQQDLIPIIQQIVNESIDDEFVKNSAEQVKEANTDYPGLSSAMDGLINMAFSPYVVDFVKVPAMKLAANKALNYYFGKNSKLKIQEKQIREHVDIVISILTPILDTLDKEYKIVDQYNVAEKIKARLKIIPLKEEEAVIFIKPLITQISIQNLTRFFVPINSVLKPILRQ